MGPWLGGEKGSGVEDSVTGSGLVASPATPARRRRACAFLVLPTCITKEPNAFASDSFVIWAREDSNLHGLPHVVLSHARIPFRHSPRYAKGVRKSGCNLSYIFMPHILNMRHGRESNPRMTVLQTVVLPLHHRAIERVQTTMFLLLWEQRRGDGTVYVEDLKSSGRKAMWVRPPPPAHRQ